MVMDGKTVYVKMPATSAAATWVKMDMRALNGSVGSNWFGGQNDPAQVLDYLRGASSSIVRVGDETVRGVATTHYTATVEFERIIASAPAANREAMRKALAPLTAAGIKSMPIEAWVDRDGLVRREDVHMSVDNTLMAGMDMTMRVELFDFGAPLRITVPEGRNVVDYSALSGA
jgi:hypothetical protein